MTIEFQAWPKTPRLNRDITITEKIDGTNAAVIVQEVSASLATPYLEGYPPEPDVFMVGDRAFRVGAQSRKRIITPGDDNFGFARWVRENAADLAAVLGEGYHYGEWWGSGIQRGYGLPKGEKRFSLFNVHRYEGSWDPEDAPQGLDVVPTLYQGPFDQWEINLSLSWLRGQGSKAALGFDRPEGVIVYHSASKQVYKVLLEDDDKPKGLVA